MTPHSAAPQLNSIRWLFDVADESDTIAFARILAAHLQKGDLVTLSGDLGSGKTAFARALIRALANDDALEVPSPTFTLIQNYDTPNITVIHCDLYRLREPDELIELDFDELSRDSLSLVEWASHAPELEARADIDIHLSLKPHTQGIGRAMAVTVRGEHISRLKSTMDVITLLASSGWLSAKRIAIAGDASGRHFERLTKNGSSAILMHAPTPVAGSILRDGKTYRTLARLSDSLGSFIAMAKALREEGVSAPEILAANIENGLALVEDFGVDGLTRDQAPIADRYREAVSLLAHLHAKSLPQLIAGQEGESYRLPSYDLEPLLTEVELFLEWYYPAFSQAPLSDEARIQFFDLWRVLIEPCLKDRQTWTLRDYHSPNLFWLSGREGHQRIGVIDIQDAVYGHPAYDLASLLQDARIAIPEALELGLIKYYADLREAADPAFNLAQFLNAYAIYAAQRVTKILGIFVRLDQRDHKPDYLQHLPHMRAYLKRNLAYPALAPLKTWFSNVLPELFDGENA